VIEQKKNKPQLTILRLLLLVSQVGSGLNVTFPIQSSNPESLSVDMSVTPLIEYAGACYTQCLSAQCPRSATLGTH
jgi:hypothetical protein